MKKMLSLLAFSVPALAYCVQAPTEAALPGTKLFYEQHPPIYFQGSNAPLLLKDIPIQISVKDLITTEKVIPYRFFSEGSPSEPFVGYLQSANEIVLEITANKDGNQIKFSQTFTTPTSNEQPIKFHLVTEPGMTGQKTYSVHGEIQRITIPWWPSLFETIPVTAYNIIINDLSDTDQPSEQSLKEPLTASTKTSEATTDKIPELNADYYEQHPVVYGTTKKTVSFMDTDVRIELTVQTLIGKDKKLDCDKFTSSLTEEFLGLVENKEQTVVGIRVFSPVGELMFLEHLTALAQSKGEENYLSAKDQNGKEYKLQVFAVKDTLKVSGSTSMTCCYHIGFGDKVIEVISNDTAPENNPPELVATDKSNSIPSCLLGEPIRDELAQKIKQGGYVFTKRGLAHFGAPESGLTVALSYFPTNTPINPEGAAEINSRISGQYAGYEFLGTHHNGTELVVMLSGQINGRRISLTTREVQIPIPYKGRTAYIWLDITPTEMEFNMTPGACNPVYEKVPVYIVSFR